MQTLAHLGAAVVDQHRSVLVDVHQRAGLVEGGQVERDPELDRGHPDGPLGVRVARVERRDLGPPAVQLAGLGHLVPDGTDPVRVPDRLAVRRGLALAVEVAPAQLVRRESEQWCAATEDVLDHDHPLRAAEPAERGLRRLVRLRDPAVDPDVRDPVRVVDVAQRPRQHRLGQIEAPPTVGGQGRLERDQPAVVVETDPPLGVEAVPLARHREVLGAVEPQSDGASGQDRAERRDRGEPVRLHLLASEAAAHPQALHRDLVVVPAEHVGDDLLRLRRVLGAGLDEDLAALVDVRQGAVGLQVEVLLTGELEAAGEHMLGRPETLVDVAALHGRLGALELAGGDGVLDVDQRRLGLDLDHYRRRAEPGRLDRLAEHVADGVSEEPDLGREQRLVVLHARVVDAGHVVRGQHPDHAGHVVGRLHVESGDRALRHEHLHGVGVQAVLGPGDQVVGVERPPGDVQRGGLVRERLAHLVAVGAGLGSLRELTHRCAPAVLWSVENWS